MAPPRVLIFDSGVGALSIAGELQTAAPALELIVAMDTGGFPYGPWPERELQQHICTLAAQLLDTYQPDIFVVACNTGSTTALPALRALTSIPIVGVVPAIKPAASISESRVIGLLATPGTVLRPYTDDLIREYAGDCTVLRVGSSELVVAIEQLYRSGADSPLVWRDVMAEFLHFDAASEMDTIVLACTHFPLVRERLKAHIHRELNWVDSGPAIARRVLSLLGERTTAIASTQHAPQHRAVLIDSAAAETTFISRLSACSIDNIEQLTSKT